MIVQDVTDSELIASLPLYRAREATALIRRLSWMRYQLSGAHQSQYLALSDVSSLENLLETLQAIHQEKESEQVLRVHFEGSGAVNEKD